MSSNSPTRIQGSIRKLCKSFGFIAGDDGQDYFFHWTGMRVGAKDFRELVMRERVEFEPVKGKDSKTRAVEITELSQTVQADV